MFATALATAGIRGADLTQDHKIPTFDMVRGLGGIDARKHWVHPSDGHPDPFVHKHIAMYMDEVMPWAQWMGEAATRNPPKITP